jgi:riboflavin synthase
MFTGIVEEIGVIKALVKTLMGLKIFVGCVTVLSDLKIGDSIAINGTCLTVTEFNSEGFYVEVVAETLRCTNFSMLTENSLVNLERAMTLQQRIGGHLLQGHVDALGEIVDITLEDSAWLVSIRFSENLRPYLINKGFIAIDGMSITIIDIVASIFRVTLIPHTLQATIAQYYRVGTFVNLEVDMLAKYLKNFIKQEQS